MFMDKRIMVLKQRNYYKLIDHNVHGQKEFGSRRPLHSLRYNLACNAGPFLNNGQGDQMEYMSFYSLCPLILFSVLIAFFFCIRG